MKLKSKILILLILASLVAKAQKEDSLLTHHIIALQFGLNQIKDENLHPQVSTGTIAELSYGFEKRKTSWQQVHFTVGYSRLKTKLEDLSKSLNLKLNLGYSRSYCLAQKKNFKYYLGPELSIAYNASYFPNWDDSHLYWADYFSIGVRNNFSLRVKDKNEWVSSVSIPLFSVFSRPDPYRLYKIGNIDFGGMVSDLNSNLAAAHLTNVFFLKVQTEYRFPVFKTKREAFTYSFEFLRVKHNDGNPFTQLSHQIGIKLFL